MKPPVVLWSGIAVGAALFVVWLAWRAMDETVTEGRYHAVTDGAGTGADQTQHKPAPEAKRNRPAPERGRDVPRNGVNPHVREDEPSRERPDEKSRERDIKRVDAEALHEPASACESDSEHPARGRRSLHPQPAVVYGEWRGDERERRRLFFDEAGEKRVRAEWETRLDSAGRELRDGLYVEYHRNGARALEGYYVAALRQGRWVSYYEAGMTLAVWGYRDDRMDGLWRAWSRAGDVLGEAVHERGRLRHYTRFADGEIALYWNRSSEAER